MREDIICSDKLIGLQRQLRGLSEVLTLNAAVAEGQRHTPPAARAP